MQDRNKIMARIKGKLFGHIGQPRPKPAKPVKSGEWNQRTFAERAA